MVENQANSYYNSSYQLRQGEDYGNYEESIYQVTKEMEMEMEEHESEKRRKLVESIEDLNTLVITE